MLLHIDLKKKIILSTVSISKHFVDGINLSSCVGFMRNPSSD